jgi:hypothetical protein
VLRDCNRSFDGEFIGEIGIVPAIFGIDEINFVSMMDGELSVALILVDKLSMMVSVSV